MAPLYQRRPYQPPTSLIQLTTTTTNLHLLFVTLTNKLSSLLYCYLTFVSFVVLFGCHYSHVSQGLWKKSDSPLVTLWPKPYQQQLPMRQCWRFPLKSTSWFQPADDAGIQPAVDDAETLPTFQLKSPFQGYLKSLFKPLQTRLSASQSNRPFQD